MGKGFSQHLSCPSTLDPEYAICKDFAVALGSSLTLPRGTVLAQPGFYQLEESETALRSREEGLNHHFTKITLFRAKTKCIVFTIFIYHVSYHFLFFL